MGQDVSISHICVFYCSECEKSKICVASFRHINTSRGLNHSEVSVARAFNSSSKQKDEKFHDLRGFGRLPGPAVKGDRS